MAQQRLTPEENAVHDVRQSARPRRHLQMYAIAGIAGLFVAGAIYSYIKTGGKSQQLVSERAGAKADPFAKPSAADFQKMVEQQSGEKPSGTVSGATAVAAAGTGTLQSTAGAQNVPAPLLPPPPPALTVEQIVAMGGGKAGPAAGDAPVRGSPNNVPPLDLPYRFASSPMTSTHPDGGVDGMDTKQAEAAFMTAPTDVYVRNRRAAGSPVDALRRLATNDTAPTNPAAVIAPALGSMGLPDAAALARVGQKSDADQRVNARLQQNEHFAERGNRPKEPLQATPAPALPYIAEGDVIPAVLTRAISTDLPGQIEARVTADVYDSFGRGVTLIPKGTRIVGLYNSGVAVGQARLQAAFTRMIFPNGASLLLENFPGADLRGTSGIPGDVNNHFFRIFGSALAVAIISYGVERSIAKDSARAGSGTVNVIGGETATPGTIAAQTFGHVAEQMLDRTASIGPTITIEAGTRINIQVTRDLAIDPKVVRA